MKQIALPKILLNPIYVSGLDQPLEGIANELDKQGKSEYATALRYAATICRTFSEVCLTKEAILVGESPWPVAQARLQEVIKNRL